jgi:hypothetical protein
VSCWLRYLCGVIWVGDLWDLLGVRDVQGVRGVSQVVRRAAGCADDELVWQDDVLGTVPGAGEEAEQHAHRGGAHLQNGDADGSERWIEVCGHFDIVHGDDGNVFRHAQVVLAEGVDGAVGQDVCTAEDGGGMRGEREERSGSTLEHGSHGAKAGVDAPLCIGDELGADDLTGFGERAAGTAPSESAVGAVTTDVGDGSVAECEQVANAEVPAAFIIVID